MEESNTIGILLRAQRESQNISIQEVAQKTKININILKSLENDDLTNLPNKTYVKGFVKNYAKTIGLDTNDAANALENTYHIKFGTSEQDDAPAQKQQLGSLQAETQEESESEEMKETLISIAQEFLNKKVIYGLAVVLVLFIIGKGVVNFFSQLSVESKKFKEETVVLKSEDEDIFDSEKSKKLREESLKEPKEEMASAQKVVKQEKEIEVEKKEEVSKNLEESKPEVAEKVAEKVTEKKAEAKKIEVPAGKYPFKKFYPAPRDLYKLNPNAEELSDTNILPPGIKTRMVEGKQSLYLIAEEGDTWISYQVDDEDIKRYVLKEGRRLFLQGDVILLFMGNLNATKIILNNQLVEAETKTGVKSLIFPESEAINYDLPLFPSYNGIPHSAKEYKEKMMASEE